MNEKILFTYRRTLKKGKVLALVGNFIGFLLFFGLAINFVYFQEKTSVVFFGKIIFIISLATLPFIVWYLLLLSRGSGEWYIQISETELIWHTPDNIGEQSFRVPIANISKIVCRSYNNAENSDYYLETLSSEQYLLNSSVSGVNLNKVCNTLEKLGVKYVFDKNPRYDTKPLQCNGCHKLK